MPKTKITASVGQCPYCDNLGLNDIPDAQLNRPHPYRTVAQCVICGRYSTRDQKGKYFPHDNPSDKNSSIAQVVFLDL